MILFSHLCQAENNIQDIERISYSCTLCRFSGRGKAALLSHARTLSHIRAEQLAEARRQAEGGDQPDIGDIFTVGECQDGEQAESSETGEFTFYRFTFYSLECLCQLSFTRLMHSNFEISINLSRNCPTSNHNLGSGLDSHHIDSAHYERYCQHFMLYQREV